MEKIKKKIDQILEKITQEIALASTTEEKLRAICTILHTEVDYYHWVGFYCPAKEDATVLTLSSYVGTPTEYTSIPVGQGVCGAVAQDKKTRVIQDVRQEKNYLSCSIHVRSEIVFPVIKNNIFVAELDIDSHQVSPFTDADNYLLQNVCNLVQNNIF